MKKMFELGIPLSREEAGKIVGGAGGEMCATDADCPMDSSCDNGVCGNKELTVKEKACEGRDLCAPCQWMFEGRSYSGQCSQNVGNKYRYCSDLRCHW